MDDSVAIFYIDLVDNLLTHERFRFYPWSWKEEMKSDALFACVRYGHNYKSSGGKRFSYFSKVCWRSFVKTIENTKKFYQKCDYVGDIDELERDSQGRAEPCLL